MTRLLILAALALACAVSTAFAMGHMDLPAGYPPSSSYADGAILGIVGALVFMLAALLSRTARATAVMAYLSMLLFSGVALAAEIGVVGDKAVVLPWGAWLVAFAEPLTEALKPLIITAILGAVPALALPLRLVLTNAVIDRMVRLGADYALNAVKGAAKDKTLSFDVSNELLRVGLQRIIGSSPRLVVWLAGGQKGVVERLFRYFNFDESVSDANTLTPVLKDIGAVK